MKSLLLDPERKQNIVCIDNASVICIRIIAIILQGNSYLQNNDTHDQLNKRKIDNKMRIIFINT